MTVATTAHVAAELDRAFHDVDETDARVTALEALLAAPWYRRPALRRALRRELRASVRHIAHGQDFREKRTEAVASGWLARR